MINISIIPPSTATEQNVLVEITQPLCEKVCVTSPSSIGGTVNFSAGTPSVINGVAVVPITATGAMVIYYPGAPCRTKTVPFAETFHLPFTATATNDLTLVPGTSNTVRFDNIRCCRSNRMTLTTTLEATIA